MKSFIKRNKFWIIGALVLFIFGASFLYFNDYYKNIDDSALESNSLVKVLEYDDYYFVDGFGTDEALIFYQGGKVDEVAYLSLLKSIAEGGVDCFLVKMPLNFALIGTNRANSIIEEYDYDFYIGGHSLGGVASCMYAYNNLEKIEGIILLASYSSKDLSDSDLAILSIYGSNDEVLNKKAYQESLVLMPDNYKETIIAGGNHSYFGTYGLQEGDKEADISNIEQIEMVSAYIVDFIEK